MQAYGILSFHLISDILLLWLLSGSERTDPEAESPVWILRASDHACNYLRDSLMESWCTVLILVLLHILLHIWKRISSTERLQPHEVSSSHQHAGA